MREPDETVAGLRRLGFTKAALYWDVNQQAYDLFLYLYNGGCGELLVGSFEELIRRKFWLNLEGRRDAFEFLIDVWAADQWLPDMDRWADMSYTETSYPAWAALAAAAKLLHLSARRHAYHAAQELLRDTLDPTGDADYIEGRIDNLEGM